jgi:hypothetical protein
MVWFSHQGIMVEPKNRLVESPNSFFEWSIINTPNSVMENKPTAGLLNYCVLHHDGQKKRIQLAVIRITLRFDTRLKSEVERQLPNKHEYVAPWPFKAHSWLNPT